ncbi:hypothetical protein A8709_06085 [Paenibacillus pectinilyticus]|uniref:F5/8 type C domain-containing protein n=1 Tax=Paenibacillus pectinilyticus TaxID=512399 RepID=A0A1C0ZT61_9BACL|nr:Ig-like domain-containing protein [Paenibacillus pectinilyticus]OCT11247.1 hypothetical protein A8709_06085 [Paenibacillus pectinilyticus]
MRGKIRARGSLALVLAMVTSLLLPPGLGVVSPSAVHADEVNLIQNGSFETLTSSVQPGWTTRTADKWTLSVDTSVTTVAPTVTVDTIYHPEGTKSLKIMSPAPNQSKLTFYQSNIPVVAGQEYKFSSWFKAQTLTGDTNAFGVNVGIVYSDSTGAALKTDYLVPVATPIRGNITDFKQYLLSTTAPTGAVSARINIEYNKLTGNVWMDDFQFKAYTALKGLAFCEPSGSISIGSVVPAPLVRTPSNTSDVIQNWTSSNPAVATVDGTGAITGVSPGTVKITATSQDNAYSAVYPLTVVPASMVTNGSFETLTAGSGNGFTDVQPTSWTASAAYGSPTVTVDDAVYGTGTHSLKIQATANGKASAVQRSIPVTAGNWYRLSGKIRTESLTGTGATVRLNWNGSGGSVLGTVYGPATAVKGTTADWQIVDGLYQAPTGSLNASIYANYETGTGKAWFDDLKIIPWVPLTGLVADGASTRSLLVGGTVSLNVYASPANATDFRVTWSSTQPGIASVGNDGRVTAKAPGTAIVTAQAVEGGWTKSYAIYVIANSNGGFETTVAETPGWTGVRPSGWSSYFGNNSPKANLSLDTTTVKEGARSLKISTPANIDSKADVYYLIPGVAPGNSYKISGWMKQQGTGNNVYLRAFYMDGGGNSVLQSPNYFDVIQATGVEVNGWKYYEGIITAPALTVSARVEVAFELGQGTLWADDIQIVPWVPITNIQLDKVKGLIVPGQSTTVNVSLSPNLVSNPEITWVSDNPAIATVVPNAKSTLQATVNGVSPGQTTIRAITEGHNPGEIGMFATYTVNVATDTDITAPDQVVSVNEDQGVTGPVLGTDANDDVLTSSLFLQPMHGTAAIRDDGVWEYYPVKDYNGTDTFTMLLTDGHNHFAFSKIDITVVPQQDAPVMDKVQINYGTIRDTKVTGTIKATDKDGDYITYALKTGQGPQHGVADVKWNGSWTYTPSAGYVGYDRFQIQVADTPGGTDVTTIVVYVGLPGSDIITALKARFPSTGAAHPRLYATADDFTRVSTLIGTDPTMQEWYTKIKAVADDMLDDPLLTYTITDPGTTGATVLPLAQAILKRIQNLGLLYQITKDTRYSAAAIAQLNLMADPAAYPDWHGGVKNFLSISEMGNAAAIGYDWLYDAMTQQERDNLRTRMIQQVLLNAKKEYLEGGSNAWWTTSPSNWNLVVNGGMTAVALTIGDEADANAVDMGASNTDYQLPIAQTVLEKALSSVQTGLGVFASQGDWPEGTGYWDYATEYLAYMISAMRTTLGTDYGFLNQPGISETSKYMANLHSFNGPFNYSDSLTTIIDTPQLLLFANLLNAPDAAWYRQFTYNKNKVAEPLDMIWYRPGFFGSNDPVKLDALYNYRTKNNVATFRDSWNDPNGNFAAIKGGVTDYNITNSSHADLDVGTFVMDALGVRWAVDLGKDTYSVPYFNLNPAQHPDRWDYYRKRAEGSNTLVINPDAGPDQALDANAPIIAYDSKPEGGYAIVDMTSAYKDDVVYAKRGMMLSNYRSSFLLQDEVKFKAPSNLYWFMHTEATDFNIAADGRSATLTQNGKRMYAQILSPSTGVFEKMDAKPFATTLSPPNELQNPKQKKLTIHFPDAKGTMTIAVRFTPLSEIEAPPTDVPVVTPLASWSIDATPTAVLSDLKLNGVTLSGFKSLKMKYAVEVPHETQTTPVITAVAADPNDTVTITQATAIPGTFVVEVTDNQGVQRPSKYFIDVTRGPFFGVLTDVPVLPITYVADSGPVNNGWPGTNAADGNPNTFWSVSGEQTIDFDLGSVTQVTYAAISWVRGNERQFYFNLLTSTDGVTWTNVYTGPSSGKVGGDYEIYDIPDTTARYLRIAVAGSNQSSVTSMTDVMVYGSQP